MQNKSFKLDETDSVWAVLLVYLVIMLAISFSIPLTIEFFILPWVFILDNPWRILVAMIAAMVGTAAGVFGGYYLMEYLIKAVSTIKSRVVSLYQ